MSFKKFYVIVFSLISILCTSLGFSQVDFKDLHPENDRMQVLYEKYGNLPVLGQTDRLKASNLDDYDKRILGLDDVEFVNQAKMVMSPSSYQKDPLNLAILNSFNFENRAQANQTLCNNAVVVPFLISGAERILDLSNPESRILFLGRTPTWLMHAAKIIAKKRNLNTENLIAVNFSGTPDIEIERWGVNNSVNKNIVTEEKLRAFEAYLDRLGLNRSEKTIYIVDMIGTGGSLTSILRILRHYYTQYHGVSLPDINFVAVNKSIHVDPNVDQSEYILYQAHGKDRYKLHMNPTSTMERSGIVKFSIDVIPLGMPGLIISYLDSVYKERWNSGIAAYAHQWTDDYLSSNVHQNPVFQEIYDKIFEPEVLNLLLHKCTKCEKEDSRSQCSKCKITKYCVRECQVSDWPRHKLECKSYVDLCSRWQ